MSNNNSKRYKKGFLYPKGNLRNLITKEELCNLIKVITNLKTNEVSLNSLKENGY